MTDPHMGDDHAAVADGAVGVGLGNGAAHRIGGRIHPGNHRDGVEYAIVDERHRGVADTTRGDVAVGCLCDHEPISLRIHHPCNASLPDEAS